MFSILRDLKLSSTSWSADTNCYPSHAHMLILLKRRCNDSHGNQKHVFELTAAPQSLFLHGKLLRPGELMDRGDRPDPHPPPFQNPQQGKPLEITAQQNFLAKQNSNWKTNNPSWLQAKINLESILSGVVFYQPTHTSHHQASGHLVYCCKELHSSIEKYTFKGIKTKVHAQNSITCNINVNQVFTQWLQVTKAVSPPKHAS